MKSEIKIMSLQEIVNLAITGKLDPNPIGQRPAVTSGIKKSVRIVRSMLSGYGCGMLTIRDIRGDEEAKKIYKADFLIIDGGHRVRAVVRFYEGKISLDGKTYIDMDDVNLSSIMVPVDIRVCTSREATELFRNINETTPVNFMEMVMSDEQSPVCEFIRSQTMYVKEYGNEVHSLFNYYLNAKGDWVVNNFDGNPNPRRKWDEYVAIALIRAIEGGLVDSGQTEIEEICANGNPPMTKAAMKVVNNFLNDALGLRKFRGKKFNQDVFSAFLVYWFGLYGENKVFTVNDRDGFYRDFMKAYTILTGTADTSLENETLFFAGQTEFVKSFVRKNIKNFSNSVSQQEVYRIFREYTEGTGIVFRTEKRSESSTVREQQLILQDYKCAIDGLPLSLEDAVFGHDTPWSEGGCDGKMIRNKHNVDMGRCTLDQYRMILQMETRNYA